jgi:MFS family permease
MGLLNLLCIGLLPFFPKTVQQARNEPGPAASESDDGSRGLLSLALGALLLHYVFNSGVWAYFERIGVASGMAPETAGAILGPGMGAAILGMIAAALLGDRHGYVRPIYVGLATITVATLALLGSSSPWVFGFATAIFNASITFVTPYMIAILALLTPSGAGVIAGNVAVLVGFATGPFLVSFLVGSGVFIPAIVMTAVGFVFVWVLYVWFVNSLGHEARLARLHALCFVKRRPRVGSADATA